MDVTELEWALAHSGDHGSYPDVFENTGIRKIIIEITSFRYICAASIHICRKDEAGRTGYWNIDVEREFTFEDFEKDPGRWRGYHVGSLTNAFLSREEAIESAIRIIKARFPGDWKLGIEDLP